MDQLLRIQEDLQNTNAILSQMEVALVQAPDLPSIQSTIRSLKDRQKHLEVEFLHAADERGQDVCAYRLFAAIGAPSLSAFTSALSGFQTLFTVMYDAVKNGPKDRARFTEETKLKTSFHFGYTFPGSVGVVFTMPNERLLPTLTSSLDDSIHAIFEIVKADSPEQIASLATRLGNAPIRATYKWAKDQADNHLGADIEWRRNLDVREQMLIQPIELVKLHERIALSGDESEEEILLSGLLVAANVLRHTFHLVVEDGDIDVRGKFSDAISKEHTVTLPMRYTARLRKRTILHFSTEQLEESYFLLELLPPLT